MTKQQHPQAYDVASSFFDSVLSKWATRRIPYEKHQTSNESKGYMEKIISTESILYIYKFLIVKNSFE